ncbi:MAG: hypothetical protein SVV80_06725 [Planctomycetota bacterium]|nr:hypothetical protein [Planctomycetota bacterium]
MSRQIIAILVVTAWPFAALSGNIAQGASEGAVTKPGLQERTIPLSAVKVSGLTAPTDMETLLAYFGRAGGFQRAVGEFCSTIVVVEGVGDAGELVSMGARIGFSPEVVAEAGTVNDSDKDGLSDARENELLLDPLNPDTDRDGIDDHSDPSPFSVDTDRPQSNGRVEIRNGVPVITVNGEPLGPMIFSDHGDTPLEFIKKLYEGGTRLFVVIRYPDYPEFRNFDGRMHTLAKAVPDAYFIIRTYGWLPKDWGKEHPDELLDIEGGVLRKGTTCYSYASKPWKDAVANMLVGMVNHVRTSPYSDRVIGYIVGQGATDESGHFGWGVDRSPAMQKYFSQWAKNKYANSVKALRIAWHDPNVTFETITVPSRPEEAVPGFGAFRDPRASQKVIDYYIAHNEVVCDALIRYAKIVKAASRGKSLVGFLYGSLNTTHYVYTGTTLAQKLLHTPEIDLLGTPMPYENRGLGDDTPYRNAVHSLMLHNKLLLNEADTRTHVCKPREVQHGRPKTLAGSFEILKRDFSRTFMRQVTGYWFGGNSHFLDEKLLPLFQKFQDISRLGLTTNNRRLGELAVIVDQDSIFYVDQHTNWCLLNTEPIQEFGRFGTNWDIYYLSDLANDRMPEYKVYLLLNPFVMDAEKLQLISRKLHRSGKVLIWMYAPGLMNLDAEFPACTKNMYALTGIKFGVEKKRLSLEMKITDRDHELTKGLPEDYTLGRFVRPVTTGFAVRGPEYKPVSPPDAANNPLFYVDDADAEVLARFVANNRPSFAVKKFPQWTSIYYGSMAMPAEMIRRLARYAGAHVFLETEDIFYVDNHFMMIHTNNRPGTRKVRLPRKVKKVVELFSNKLVAENAETFTVDLKPLSTYLYYWGN